jgi:hypothetical protein
MKLFINNSAVTLVVSSMMPTRVIASVSSLEIAPLKGINKAIISKPQSKAAIWLTSLFLDLTPGVQANNNRPTAAGMRAVTDGVSDEIYPQKDSRISKTALLKFAMYGFIFSLQSPIDIVQFKK